MNKFVFITPFMFGIPGVAFANSCEGITYNDFLGLSDTAIEIQNRSATVTGEVGKAVEPTEEMLADEITATALSGSDSGNGILNFLPFLSISGLSGSLDGDSGENKNDNLGFDFNIPLPGKEENARELKIAASFNRQPQVFEPLIMSVAEDERDGVRSALEADLNLTDDATLSISYNVSNESLGRYRGMIGNFFGKIIESVDAGKYLLAFRNYAQIARTIDKNDGGGPLPERLIYELNFVDTTTNRAIANVPPDNELDKRRQALCDAIFLLRDADRELTMLENIAVKESGLDTIAKLASNQPQLHFSLSARDRAEAIGPNELSAKLTFEWGYRANLNKLKSTCADSGCVLSDYLTYLADNKQIIDASDRLSFSLEYVDVDDYQFSLADTTTVFSKPGSDKFVGTLGYGRLMNNNTLGVARFDLTLKYEDVDDEQINDRAVGVLSITKKFGEITMPFNIVYSNKPEFVEMETDNRISAHLGIKFEFQGD